MINYSAGIQNYSSQEKPTVLSSIGKGITTELKAFVPIYNLYMVGDEFCKIESSKENLENAKSGNGGYEEKTTFQKIMKGLGKVLLTSIPIIGTYALGKTKNEKEALKDEIAGRETQEAGVIKNFFTGLLEKIKLAIPFYNVYYIGKESLEATNIQNDVNDIYVKSMDANLQKSNIEFNDKLHSTIADLEAKMEAGEISSEKAPELMQLKEMLNDISNNPNIETLDLANCQTTISDKLCEIMNNS